MKDSFSLKDFKKKWKGADRQTKQEMMQLVGDLDIRDGLEPVMLGIKDYTRPVREDAKTALRKLSRQAALPNAKYQDLPSDIVRNSCKLSAVLYREMKTTKDMNLIELYFYALLISGGWGPILAWHYFSQGNFFTGVIAEKVKKFPEFFQLVFIHQYTMDSVTVRRQYTHVIDGIVDGLEDKGTIVSFLAYLFDHAPVLDSIFADLSKKLGLESHIQQNELTSDDLEDRGRGIKAALVLGKGRNCRLFLEALSSWKSTDERVALLKLLADSSGKKHPEVIKQLFPLLEDENPDIVSHAFEALATLKAPGIGKTASDLYQKHPFMKDRIHDRIHDFDWIEQFSFLNGLPADQEASVRLAIAQKFLKTSPEKMAHFLTRCEKSKDNTLNTEAGKCLEEIESVKQREIDEIAEKESSKQKIPREYKKGFMHKMATGGRKKDFQRLLSGEPVNRAGFQGESISGAVLPEIRLTNVDFSGAELSDVDFSSAKLVSVSFNGASLKNVKFENASFSSVSFKKATLHNVTASNALMDDCDFSGSRIQGSGFENTSLRDSSFMNAEITDTRFSRSDLTASTFLHADLSRVNFDLACLHVSDFSLASAQLCDFFGVDFSTTTRLHSKLNIRSTLFNDIALPPVLFQKPETGPDVFRSLMLSEEMEKTHRSFLSYNAKRIELALDTCVPEQCELVELIPLLIHSDLEILPEDKPVQKAPAGIYGYHPSPTAQRLLVKYFKTDGSRSFPETAHQIVGLYTIGSLGTIAQSVDSDIDYWICVDEPKLGEKKLARLKSKLAAIENWAFRIFSTEIHFFVVDLSRVREDRFGGSDMESSGSAQGKILKEEFYRTMILVAGKIPLWCAIPPGTKEKHYQHLRTIASQYHKDYLDLGNVTSIPKGEYFGASIWQLLKALKSPYKSVIKMGLLEKYMREDEGTSLLCNRLKAAWSSGGQDLAQMDPYLMLFKEVLDYYQRTNQTYAVSLLQICFFLKLGIQSITDLDMSVLPVRKNAVLNYFKSWQWNESNVQDLGSFRDWSFEKIFLLSNRINQFMVETYEKLGKSLQNSTDEKVTITSEDLTILGRKMFAQFSKQPYKVEKLPLITHGKHLFKQLYVQYKRNGNGPAVWQLYHMKKNKQKTQSTTEILKELGRIEEIAIWLVRNNLFTSTASLQLMPNPTPISMQDILDFVKILHEYFPLKDIERLPTMGLLRKPYAVKLFLAVNLSLDRKLHKIHEYTGIYMTSWGEFFCRTFYDKKGITSIEDATAAVKKQLDIPFAGDDVGYFIPRGYRNRIRLDSIES